VVPGALAAAAGFLALPGHTTRGRLLRELDWLSLIAFGMALGFLIVGLKQAPRDGWLSLLVISLFAASAIMLVLSVRRTSPAIMFHLLRDRSLAFGCMLSFILGFILFASVYILPVFFAFVGGMTPLAIGLITITMGFTQIIAAPVSVWLDRRFDARLLTAAGFILFALGLALNARLTVASGEADVWWAQVVRGAAVALCILPPIRMALALQPIAGAQYWRRHRYRHHGHGDVHARSKSRGRTDGGDDIEPSRGGAAPRHPAGDAALPR